MSRKARPGSGTPVGVALLVTLATASGAAGMQAGATLSGTVSDASGTPLVGVSVVARLIAPAGPAQSVETSGTGSFAFNELGSGTYDVMFILPGFEEHLRTGIEVGAASATTLNVQMAMQLDDELIAIAPVVVVGSRSQLRSVTESPSPIDAIPFQDFVNQGPSTLDYQLRTLVPSFNVATHPISDAATLVRPATLRNLAHHHTLVLVNGKRRHRSSVIAWFAGVTDGAQGPDISTIPSIALRQVEVLRDGASAQYGSDAIAGVINLEMKDGSEGGSLELNTGT